MRQLRLIRVADDTGELVLDSADGLESYRLPVDDVLRKAVERVPAASEPAAPAAAQNAAQNTPQNDVQVGPREIQVRIRGGESPQELADSLGVSIERIMRFAGPVMDERLRITDEARRARARRAGTETELVQFGETVDARFTAHGLVPADVSWDSRRRDDGDWIVTADWAGGEGRHTAEWLFHRATRLVSPLDDTAGDLLSDRPIRPVVAPEPAPVLTAAPPLVPGVVAFPPMPEALTGPLPRYQDVFDQDAPVDSELDGPRDVPPLVPTAALEYDEPPLPLGITDPSERPGTSGQPVSRLTNVSKRRDDSDEDKAARARIPSWDDILLGVRRKD